LIRAGRLVAEPDPKAFAPTQGVRVEAGRDWSKQFISLDLSQGVVITRDYFTAQGDSISLDPQTRHTLILSGKPAQVMSKQGAIVGENMLLGLVDNSLVVPQAGEIRQSLVNQQGELAIAWKGQLKYQPDASTANITANITGGITLSQTDKLGRSTTLTGDDAVITFAPSQGKPTTSAFEGELKSVAISGSTRVVMTSPDAQRDRFSRVTILSDKLEFDQTQQTIAMPQAGRLLAEGVRLEQGGAMPGQKQVGGAQTGTAALSWNQQMLWTLPKGELAVVGQTAVAFEPAQQPDAPASITRLFATRIDLRLSPTTIGGDQQPDQQAMQLLAASASGEVSMRSDELSFDAGRLEFDALTNLATASGANGRAVEVFTQDGRGSARFDGLKWDVATGQVKDLRGIDVRAR
jgi:hypothetical protein